MRPKVIVFARSPRPGTVKTRLSAVLSEESAAALHMAMVIDLFTASSNCDAQWISNFIRSNLRMRSFLRESKLKVQVPGNLGDRLCAAIAQGLEGGRPAALVIGSDSPIVPLEHISELLGAKADVALGPADLRRLAQGPDLGSATRGTLEWAAHLPS